MRELRLEGGSDTAKASETHGPRPALRGGDVGIIVVHREEVEDPLLNNSDNLDTDNYEGIKGAIGVNGESRRLEEISYWRKRAGWYDDATETDDVFVPETQSSSSASSSSGVVGSDYSIATKIVGVVVVVAAMFVLAKQFASLGNSRRSSSSNERGRSKSKSSSEKLSRSRSRSRMGRQSSSRRSRSRSRARDRTSRSRSRSKSRKSSRSKSISDGYNLMDDGTSPSSQLSSKAKMLV
mmetsp:Transcript_13940/g.18266  ORF Transcript_13940/g.18266 Transcript_13940/m.18266 type:complete len:238 (-) Transcript_13940:74-787(-)|eukprot:CAMPEP_0116066812 /NCGR_PEP_ID=MMETSP0322-20121206/10619_1 /TAXON_ID=163516 /ORGANISM="Leptocylindrus danicus var. apora, Strain B651" /LENGTH=237 /DNA_ID=CAMNT_0003553465 /DNA_START=57 /DNA_END=770 /DNA_ORIENTATION=+